jgi:hypothetical protein
MPHPMIRPPLSGPPGFNLAKLQFGKIQVAKLKPRGLIRIIRYPIGWDICKIYSHGAKLSKLCNVIVPVMI